MAVSRTPQSAAQLRGELLAVHAQIVSTLARAPAWLASLRASRTMISAACWPAQERTLDRLLDSVERDPGGPPAGRRALCASGSPTAGCAGRAAPTLHSARPGPSRCWRWRSPGNSRPGRTVLTSAGWTPPTCSCCWTG